MSATAAPIPAAAKREHDDDNDQEGFHLKVHRNSPLAGGCVCRPSKGFNDRFRALFPANSAQTSIKTARSAPEDPFIPLHPLH